MAYRKIRSRLSDVPCLSTPGDYIKTCGYLMQRQYQDIASIVAMLDIPGAHNELGGKAFKGLKRVSSRYNASMLA
jgi:hypothetical protein